MKKPAVDVMEDVKAQTPGNQSLAEVSRLAQQLIDAESQVEEFQARLKQAQVAVMELKQRQLPDTMQELGIKSFKLTSGAEVKVEPFFRCSLAGKAKEAAITWLKETEQDGLLTREITVPFGKGELDRSKALHEALLKKGYAAALTESVNTASFKKLVRESLEAGLNPPLDTMGVFQGKEAVIIPPKQ